MKLALCIAVLLLAVAATWFRLSHARPALPKYKAVPDFNLTERSGQPLNRSDLLGKVWLADFIYTACPGPCPMLSSRFSALQKEALQHPDVRLVSISIDPEKDTPAVLREYAAHFGASDGWLFLTGPKQQVRDLVTSGFMQSVVEQNDPATPIVHATGLALVDRNGIMRAFYEGTEKDNDAAILRDIERLRRE